MDEQTGWIVWLGIDVDHHDQPEMKLKDMVQRVLFAAGDLGNQADGVSVRSSCGGRGLHIIRRLAHPIMVPAGSGSKVYNALTTLLNEPLVKAIEDAGIEVCKSDSRMFWLHGGANEWIVQSEGLTPTPPKFSAPVAAPATDRQVPALPGGLDPFVSSWLIRLQVSPGPCYVGAVVARLREIGETVKTRSPMSGNGATNGYIDVRPGEVGLWSYADGHTIWRVMDESDWTATDGYFKKGLDEE
jgi:hypothetical protein